MPSFPLPPDDDRLLIVSPHLDDAVFSCGTLMALRPNVRVLTVFAGIPPAGQELTDWDRSCGFAGAREAMLQRREEDRHALLLFSAHPEWMEFLDSQYREENPVQELHAALAESVKNLQPRHVFFPLGLFHSDHEAVHLAMLKTCRRFPELSWWMYEDALYRRIPGLLQQRLATLQAENVRATPVDLCDPVGMEVKKVGVQCYASQLQALKERAAHYADVYQTERYWRLETS